jgi:hypothetical protein
MVNYDALMACDNISYTHCPQSEFKNMTGQLICLKCYLILSEQQNLEYLGCDVGHKATVTTSLFLFF